MAGDDADIFSSMVLVGPVPDEASAINDERHFNAYMLLVIYRVKEPVAEGEAKIWVNQEKAAETRERIVGTAAEVGQDAGFGQSMGATTRTGR